MPNNHIAEINTASKHRLSPFYRFFCWCSGARLYILEQCPSDYNKFYGIGMVVFLTGVMASLSGGYAIHTVFESLYVSVPFGLLWGFLIFSIDWYLVASLRKQNKASKEFLFALPRLVLAVFIAVVISKPIEMKLFEREINQQIVFDQQQKSISYQKMVNDEFQAIDMLEQENRKLRDEIARKEEQRTQLFNLFIAEAEGRSPTQKVGKGPVYREKKAEYEKIDEELKIIRENNIKAIDQNNNEIQRLKKLRDDNLLFSFKTSRHANGFLARLEAIGSITANSRNLLYANYFIILLFICIECAPVIVKLMSARGPYDELLEAEEYLKLIEVSKMIAKTEMTEDQKLDFHQLLIHERNKTLIELEKEKIMNMAKAEREINRAKIQSWKKEELKKLSADENSPLLEPDASFPRQPDAGELKDESILPDKEVGEIATQKEEPFPLREDGGQELLENQLHEIESNTNCTS